MSSSGTFVDRIDPFAKRSLKKKQKKSQGSSRFRNQGDVELTALPLLKGMLPPPCSPEQCVTGRLWDGLSPQTFRILHISGSDLDSFPVSSPTLPGPTAGPRDHF
jgi:hypothetical protein